MLRPAKDGRPFSVFCATPEIPSAAIRHFARMAGARVRTTRDAAVDVRRGMVAITAGEGGTYDLDVDEGEWFDLVSGKSVGKGPHLLVEMPPQSTRIFLDAPSMERYRKGSR